MVYAALVESGFEKRGEIIRLVQTLRGGDRPKNAHDEFADVTVMPRSGWEPWGLFRKPCEGRVQDNLREWKTGGLRRISVERPFGDVIRSAPTRPVERDIAPHPSLKPQSFMRQIVRAALPLGEGIVLDPFWAGVRPSLPLVQWATRVLALRMIPRFSRSQKAQFRNWLRWRSMERASRLRKLGHSRVYSAEDVMIRLGWRGGGQCRRSGSR